MTTLIWHIDRAEFKFENTEKITQWKKNPEFFFEFTPSTADVPGENLFQDVYDVDIYQKIEGKNSIVKVAFQNEKIIVSAWVVVDVATTEEFNEKDFAEWAYEYGGWFSATISLGDYEATIIGDDGGEWRIGG